MDDFFYAHDGRPVFNSIHGFKANRRTRTGAAFHTKAEAEAWVAAQEGTGFIIETIPGSERPNWALPYRA